MNKKILLFSRDPGGANTIIPLFDPLKEKDYHVELFGKDFALKKYRKFNLSGKDIMDHITSVSVDELVTFLKKIKPDFIITGTSFDDFTEKYLWQAGEILKIPSFALLDQWVNYRSRFSVYGVFDGSMIFPDKILVMDEFAKKEMIAEGIEANRILVTGQPYFELLMTRKKKIPLNKTKKIKSGQGIGASSFVITYVSEPISKNYKSEDYWGYTEMTVFGEILVALKTINVNLNKKIAVIIRPHPREEKDNWTDIISSFKNNNITLLINDKINSLDLILSSDLVCGMSSMFLLEAVILGKPVISVQIGLKRESPFILDRRGIAKSIQDRKTLYQELQSAIMENKYKKVDFDFIKNPVKNVIGKMEEYL